MRPSGILSGRRGVVLGVSTENGAGYACAAAAMEQGATVAITHRPGREGVVGPLAARLGAKAFSLEATDESSVEAALVGAATELGGLDFVVHSLVRVPDGVLSRPVTALTAAEFQETMEISVRSLLVACRFARPYLERSSAPRVVVLSSCGGVAAMPNYHAVGIAKAALEAATRYLALELGPSGVLCNVVSFSLIETDAAVRVVGAGAAEATRRHLAKRALTRTNTTLGDVGQAAAYFASPFLRNVTAETFTVDGGFSQAYF